MVTTSSSTTSYAAWRGCTSKIAYATLGDAQRAVTCMWKARRDGRGLRGLRAYKCTFCPDFHVGHAPEESHP